MYIFIQNTARLFELDFFQASLLRKGIQCGSHAVAPSAT